MAKMMKIEGNKVDDNDDEGDEDNPGGKDEESER